MKNKYKELEGRIIKFQHHLETHQKSPDKKHHSLDEQLAFIRLEVKDFPIKGLHKQDELVNKHYLQYLKTGEDEDFSALENDLTTLLDYIREHDRGAG